MFRRYAHALSSKEHDARYKVALTIEFFQHLVLLFCYYWHQEFCSCSFLSKVCVRFLQFDEILESVVAILHHSGESLLATDISVHFFNRCDTERWLEKFDEIDVV